MASKAFAYEGSPMRIVCPQCGYSRDISGTKIPASSSIATCPKCQFRFRFRGHQHPSTPDGGLDEPVYPPRPSRPTVVEKPSPYQSPAPYEPRSQRLPAPEAEPEHYAHTPPRPQARWLPDSEPAFEPDSEPVLFQSPSPAWPEPLAIGRLAEPASIPQSGYEHEPAPRAFDPEYDARDPARPAEPRYDPTPRTPRAQRGDDQSFEARRPASSPEPEPGRLNATHRPGFGPDPASVALRPGPGLPLRPAPPVSPESFESLDDRPAPWERMRFEPDQTPATPPSLKRTAGITAQARLSGMAEDEPLPPEFALPGTRPGGRLEHEPGPEDAQDGVLPSETLAGQDSVRDIWSRLQSMGGDAKAPMGAPLREKAREPAPTQPHPDSMAPWEQLEHYGVVPAFMGVIKNILARPGDFFDQMPPASGKVRPLIFSILLSVAVMVFVLIWHFFGLKLGGLTDLGHTEGFQGLGSGPLGGMALLGLAPILTAAFVFLDSALAHLLLGLLRSATKSFDETFRTICYAGGPWMLAALPVPYSYLIPVVLIWHMTLQAIGLKKLHHAGYPQVLATVLVKWSLYFMASFAFLHVLMTRA